MSDKPHVCPKCHGSGQVRTNAEIGAEMRAYRKAAGVSARAVAKALGFTAPYVSDLELGHRNWNEQRERDFRAAVDAM